MVSQTNNNSSFASTMDITSTRSKKGRIEHRDVSKNSFFSRSKININILNIARSYLSIGDFKSSLFVCKEWNGTSLHGQIDRYLSLSPRRAIDIVFFARSYDYSHLGEPNPDHKTDYVDSAFEKLPDSWKKAFFLGISKLKIFNFFNVVPNNLRLPLLEKASQLEVIDIFEPSKTEIQVLALIPNLDEVYMIFSDETLNDEDNLLQISVMPLFRNDSLKKLLLVCRDDFFVNESAVNQYAPNLEVLKIMTKDWNNIEIEDYIPKFHSVVKKIPSLKVLSLDMSLPCLEEIIDSLPNLQELEFIGASQAIKGLNRAYSLEKLIFRNCFINYGEEIFEDLYDSVSNLPKLKTVDFIMDFHFEGVLEEMVQTKIATISNVFIKTPFHMLPEELIKIKTVFLHLIVQYSDFSPTNPKRLLLKKITGLEKLQLEFDFIDVDLKEDEKENLINFFQEFSQEMYAVTGIVDKPFIKEYLKNNPLPNLDIPIK